MCSSWGTSPTWGRSPTAPVCEDVRFDERLWEYADWDFLLTLTEHRTPLELPAVALRYHTGGTRLSGAHPTDDALVREKWAARRAVREAAQQAANLGRSTVAASPEA